MDSFEECRDRARTYTFLPKTASHDASTAGDDDDEDGDSDVEEDHVDFRARAATLAEGLTCIIESTETETEAKKDVSTGKKFVYANDAWIGLKLLSRKLLRALTKKSQPRERYIPDLTIRTLKIAPHSMIPPAD